MVVIYFKPLIRVKDVSKVILSKNLEIWKTFLILVFILLVFVPFPSYSIRGSFFCHFFWLFEIFKGFFKKIFKICSKHMKIFLTIFKRFFQEFKCFFFKLKKNVFSRFFYDFNIFKKIFQEFSRFCQKIQKRFSSISP